jgi:hypothetical protein
LNNNLYSDKVEPRGRKPGGLDVSHIEEKKDYGTVLMKADNANINSSEENGLDSSFMNTNNISESALNFRDMKTKKSLESSKLSQINNKQANINNRKSFIKSSGNNNNQAEHIQSKNKNNYIFKAKSIEKNLDKFPVENSNKFLIKEVNRPYTDHLTIKQESITDNLRGRKYYMNYLYNIFDKDLKVKDTFRVDKWANEILGKKENFIKKRPLPESVEAFFVFNDKKLNLKKYKYLHHKDFEFRDNECAFLSHNLKYLPLSVLEIMPVRLRNYGKFVTGRDVNLGTLGIRPDSMNITHVDKLQVAKTNTRSGKTYTTSIKNNSRIITSSAFTNHNTIIDQIKYTKGLHEKIYKKVDTLNYRT